MNNPIKNNQVYIAAPLRLLDSDLYTRAKLFLLQNEPNATLDARGLFKSNKEWLANYTKVLIACDVMVVVSDNALVGAGVYKEFQFFKERKCKAYHYCESGGFKTLIEISKLQVINENDWIDYAVIKY